MHPPRGPSPGGAVPCWRGRCLEQRSRFDLPAHAQSILIAALLVTAACAGTEPLPPDHAPIDRPNAGEPPPPPPSADGDSQGPVPARVDVDLGDGFAPHVLRGTAY